MNWKAKALYLKAVGILPSSLENWIVYWIQRNLGALRDVDPTRHLQGSAEVGLRIQSERSFLQGKRVLEIGPGRRLNLSIGLWLLGADEVIAIDVTPQLKYELVREDIEYCRRNIDAVLSLFPNEPLIRERFSYLLASIRTGSTSSLSSLLHKLGIKYLAPVDTRNMEFRECSFDFVVSMSVLEHIVPSALRDVLRECGRVLRDDGMMVHYIDYVDHYSYIDSNINPINFLMYDESSWKLYGSNPHMYVNRLRDDDVRQIYSTSGQRVKRWDAKVDQELLRKIQENKIKVHSNIRRNRDASVLATTGSWIISEKLKS